MKKQNNNGFELSSDVLLDGGRMATNFLGTAAAPVGGMIEVAGAQVERGKLTKQAASIFDDDVATLKVDNPAFKRHVKETLSSLEIDRVTGFGMALAGSAAAVALAALILPAMIMTGPVGWVSALLIAGAGGIGGNMLKDMIWPSDYNQFTRFASELQADAQQGNLSAEKAFVAASVTMLDKHGLDEIYASIPKVKSERDLIKLLDSEEGRVTLHHAMIEHDQLIRNTIGAVNISPDAPVSQQLANIANNKQIAGLDLLSVERVSHLGTMIGLHDMQQNAMQQQNIAEAQPLQNPNQHLPNKSASRDVVI